MEVSRLLSVSLLLFGLAAASNFDGHQVWRLNDLSASQAKDINTLLTGLDFDVWSHGRDWLDVRVPPHLARPLQRRLQELSVPHTIMIDDVQRKINEERKGLNRSRGKTGIHISEYNELEAIEAYMSEVSEKYEWVSLKSIGKTFEGRDLWVNILAVPGDTPKPAVWIDCGIHAREWITQATCLYGLEYLTTQYGTDEAATSLLDAYDIYLMPMHNPDGYYYTWHNDRLWRKNRMQHEGSICHGVDLNRNWDDGHWGGAGTSDNSCSDIYKGPEPFSELETQAVRDYTSGLMTSNNLTAYFTIHCYSQLWMYAYGWTGEATPDDADLYRISEIGVVALRAVHDTRYQFGSIYNAIYPASGTSIDWSYSSGVVHTYTLELRDTGSNGFLLPATEIIPTGQETWAGLIAAILAI
ncbi:carboxypeptidase B-like [Penaeus japonicus]|uniref:carboxypeptidase B-like n=1 Tax=Penaeus japonicus TaxID=27405 RepID=UPI001C70B027|nr:carboxypeptidase B-like [Penaeus japonicus]